WIYGVTLEPGRRRAMARLAPAHGERILEIGVGTGFAAARYPPHCRVVAIDLSAAMLDRARGRLAQPDLQPVTLCPVDAARLAFPDGVFDAVYAPYVMNVVPDPVRVAREMRRVCRPSGRLVLLNHFDQAPDSGWNRLIGKLAAHAEVNWNLTLSALLEGAGLTAQSIEPVNVPRVSSVVVCRRT